MELRDKVVLITGSSQGIGKETALRFAKEGAKVVVTYNTNKSKAEEVFKECNKLSECFLVQLDVTNEGSIKNCVESVIDKFGAIDILINNAGVLFNKDFVEQSNSEIDLQINTNVKGLIKMTKVTLPYLQGQDEGMIINIASICSTQVYHGLTTYCATKFAVRGFTQALALELPKKIKIYTVNPGLTATQMTNFNGVSAEKVAEVVLNTAKEKYKVYSGEDINVLEYI